jgi:hypothetical protein
MKVGPSYNKRAIQTPDEALIAQFDIKDGMERRFSTKLWAQHSKFESTDQDLSSRKRYPVSKDLASISIRSEESSLENSHSTEIFALEGPRLSDVVDNFTEERGIELKSPTEWRREDREIKDMDAIRVSS